MALSMNEAIAALNGGRPRYNWRGGMTGLGAAEFGVPNRCAPAFLARSQDVAKRLGTVFGQAEQALGAARRALQDMEARVQRLGRDVDVSVSIGALDEIATGSAKVRELEDQLSALDSAIRSRESEMYQQAICPYSGVSPLVQESQGWINQVTRIGREAAAVPAQFRGVMLRVERSVQDEQARRAAIRAEEIAQRQTEEAARAAEQAEIRAIEEARLQREAERAQREAQLQLEAEQIRAEQAARESAAQEASAAVEQARLEQQSALQQAQLEMQQRREDIELQRIQAQMDAEQRRLEREEARLTRQEELESLLEEIKTMKALQEAGVVPPGYMLQADQGGAAPGAAMQYGYDQAAYAQAPYGGFPTAPQYPTQPGYMPQGFGPPSGYPIPGMAPPDQAVAMSPMAPYSPPGAVPQTLIPPGYVAPAAGPFSWEPGFTPGRELFGLGGLGAADARVTNPALKGAMIQMGYKIFGPLTLEGRRVYQIERPNGSRFTIGAATAEPGGQKVADPQTGQVVYQPPIPGGATPASAANQAPTVDPNVVNQIASLIERAVASGVDVYKATEDVKSAREARRAARDGVTTDLPAASIAPPGGVPTWVYGLGALAVAGGVIYSVARPKRRRSR